ncbi:MAG: hypothetical protein ACRDTM_09500 [Micromonosporaceae bacterium]
MRLTAYQRRGFTRVLAGLAVAAVAVVGLAACGGGDRIAARTADTAPRMELTAEEAALVDLGFDTSEVRSGSAPSASAEDGKPNKHHKGRHHGSRHHLGKRVLHGELVVSTPKGPKTILVQRGTITAVDADSMTVKSADGYTLTWTFADKLRVLERRKTVDGDALEVGETVGVVGGKTSAGGAARLIVIAKGR